MAELVAYTSAAIAVDENLTTLIDWTNIESLAGFTLIISNTAGGDNSPITDVQIDTSNDRGVSASLDRHDGVPPVPILANKSSLGSFVETAKFVRIRAICTAGATTTAKAWLLADTSSGRICTLDDVKGRLGESDIENDSTLARIILGIEDIFNIYTRRKLILNAADVTEYYTGSGNRLQLTRYPLVSVTSIKQAVDYEFDTAEALEADSAYRLIGGGINGIIYRANTTWFSTPDAIQVIYRGGYCAAGQTPGDGETTMPADLREAAIEQTTFIHKRRDDIGLSGVGFEGGSMNKFSAIDLLPMVKRILDNYRRPAL